VIFSISKLKYNWLFVPFQVVLFLCLSNFGVRAQAVLTENGKTASCLIPQAYAYAVLKPLYLTDARVTGAYLGAYSERIRDRSILDLYGKMKKVGSLNNFNIVVEGTLQKHIGYYNEDEWVYKMVEAAGLYAPHNKAISDTFQLFIPTILAAQDKDGYLNTYFQNPLIIKKEVENIRFRPLNRFELYDFGHMAQAGIAWKLSTGDERLFKASIKFADLLCDRFGSTALPYQYNSPLPQKKYEHPNHEMAMVELYRITGNKRYLDFAAHTLDYYGFWSFPEVWGHCVQENLLLCGGADVYLETGKPEMLKHLQAMWTDITEHKMYITGGVGNGVDKENYGKADVLPNVKNYCETCSAISKMFFDFRMILATGNAKYTDDMERTFYNAVLSGISLSGTEYFYTNHMEEGGEKHKNMSPDSVFVGNDKRDSQRKPYWPTSCCAPNLLRLMGSIQQYLFTVSKDGIQTQLYGNSELAIRLGSGQNVSLRETTDYPRNGKIQFDILADGKYNLAIRIPKWVADSKVTLILNGKPEPIVKEHDYVSLNRKWKTGDRIILELEMKTKLLKGRDLVASEKGKLAIMRGPLVYCLESPDNKNVEIFDLSLVANTTFDEEYVTDLGGTIRLVGKAFDETNKKEIQIKAIPYHLWANRGESTMRLWIPEKTLTSQ